MTQRLIIIMPSFNDGPGLWGVVEGERVLTHGRGAPPVNDSSKETVAILSGQSVRIYPHTLPATSKRDRLRAAGFSIEDKIAVPLSRVHIALSDDRIAVMDKTELSAKLAQLKEAGLSPTKAIADFEALMDIEGPVSLLGRAVTTGLLGHAMDAGWTDEGRAYPDEALLSAIGAKLERNDVLNILQNDFSPKNGFNVGWRKLIPLASLAACLGIAALFLHGADARALKLQAADMKLQTAQIYMDATGQTAPRDPARAAMRAMKSGGEDTLAFLRLSQILFNGIEQIDGLTVNQLRYQEPNYELQLRLIYPSFESAGQLESAIRAAGGQLITGGVREQSGQFVGEATLRGGSS